MAYVPPSANEVVLEFKGDPGVYVPPSGVFALISFLPNVFIRLQRLSLTSGIPDTSLLPGAVGVALNAVALVHNAQFEDILTGNISLDVESITSTADTATIIVGRGTHIHHITSSAVLQPIHINPGSIAVDLEALSVLVQHRVSRSSLVSRLKTLQLSNSTEAFHIHPGPIAFSFSAIASETSASIFDRIYQPVRGLGPVIFQAYYARTNNNTGNNGGTLSEKRIKNIHNSIFPPISDEERQTGGTTFRKIFWRNVHQGNSNFLSGIIYIDKEHPDDHIITIISGTYQDTQISIPGNAREYGTSTLNTEATYGSTTLVLALKNADLDIFKTNDTVVISNGTYSERLDNVTVVSKVGAIVTLTVSPLKYTHTVGSIVSSCIKLSTLSNYVSKVTATSVFGTFDSTYGIDVYGNGSIKQKWEILFTSETTYTCRGYDIGVVGTGIKAQDFAPINPYTGTPYFNLNGMCLKGAFQEGDTVTFVTDIAVTSLWAKRVFPMNTTASLSTFHCSIQGYI